MDLITKFSKKTVQKLNNEDIINNEFNQSDYVFIEGLIKKYRKKDVKVSNNDIKLLSENGATVLYGEFFKFIIILIMAYFLNIFFPSFIIMSVFTLLRRFAGGIHMSTFNKCFIIMIASFLSLGFLADKIQFNILYTLLGLLLCTILAYKYSPQEREDKTDKDKDYGNKYKKLTIYIILIGYLLSLLLYYNNYILVANSIIMGILLEISTITPIGTRFFIWIDKKMEGEFFVK